MAHKPRNAKAKAKRQAKHRKILLDKQKNLEIQRAREHKKYLARQAECQRRILERERERIRQHEIKKAESLAGVKKRKDLIKFLREDLIHKGFEYKEGLNVDTIPFNPSGNCRAGGLYFTSWEFRVNWMGWGPLIADVEIPEDAQVYVEEDLTKWKADKIIIKNIRKYKDEDDCKPNICSRTCTKVVIFVGQVVSKCMINILHMIYGKERYFQKN